MPTIDEDEILVCESKELKWPSRARLDMAAFTHSYHMMYGCAHDLLPDSFLQKNQQPRDLLKQKINEHRDKHTDSCWKKRNVCRFGPLP